METKWHKKKATNASHHGRTRSQSVVRFLTTSIRHPLLHCKSSHRSEQLQVIACACFLCREGSIWWASYEETPHSSLQFSNKVWHYKAQRVFRWHNQAKALPRSHSRIGPLIGYKMKSLIHSPPVRPFQKLSWASTSYRIRLLNWGQISPLFLNKVVSPYMKHENGLRTSNVNAHIMAYLTGFQSKPFTMD